MLVLEYALECIFLGIGQSKVTIVDKKEPVEVLLDADVCAGVVLSHYTLHVWHRDR